MRKTIFIMQFPYLKVQDKQLDNKLAYFTPEQIRHQTLMRLKDVLTELSRRKPLLLILEDLHWTDDDFKEPTILDLWNYRKKEARFAEGCIKMSDLTKDHIVVKTDSKPGLSPSQRQWLHTGIEVQVLDRLR